MAREWTSEERLKAAVSLFKQIEDECQQSALPVLRKIYDWSVVGQFITQNGKEWLNLNETQLLEDLGWKE